MTGLKHLQSQHDPDRCEAIIPGSAPIPVTEYQSNRCCQDKGHEGAHYADFCAWKDPPVEQLVLAW